LPYLNVVVNHFYCSTFRVHLYFVRVIVNIHSRYVSSKVAKALQRLELPVFRRRCHLRTEHHFLSHWRRNSHSLSFWILLKCIKTLVF